MRLLSLLPVAALLCARPVHAQSSRGATLALTVAPECSVTIVSLSTDDQNSQTLTYNYRLRTSRAGSGEIILRSGEGVPATVIARFGPDAHSARGGSTGSVRLSTNPAAAPPPSLQISCH